MINIFLCFIAVFLAFIFENLFLRKRMYTEKIDFMDRNYTLLLKGIAILCVVFSHLGNANNLRIFAPLGGIGVALFLICSGYGLNESSKKGFSVISFWKKRVFSVIFPYLLVRTIYVIVTNSFSLKDFVLDVLCIKPKYSYGWYLPYILIWYIIFFVSQIAEMRFGFRGKISVLVLFSVLSFLFAPSELQAEQCISFTTGVILSYYSNKKLNQIIKERRFILSSGFIILGAIPFVVKQLCSIESEFVLYFLQLGYKYLWAMALLVVLMLVVNKFSINLITFLGKISYEIYLLHGYLVIWMTSITKIPLFIFSLVILSFFLHKVVNLITNSTSIKTKRTRNNGEIFAGSK